MMAALLNSGTDGEGTTTVEVEGVEVLLEESAKISSEFDPTPIISPLPES
jgi:hypothetical protein